MYTDHVRKLSTLRKTEVFQFAKSGGKYWVSWRGPNFISYLAVGDVVRHHLRVSSAARINVICHGC